jgi:hypothetical protein
MDHYLEFKVESNKSGIARSALWIFLGKRAMPYENSTMESLIAACFIDDSEMLCCGFSIITMHASKQVCLYWEISGEWGL